METLPSASTLRHTSPSGCDTLSLAKGVKSVSGGRIPSGSVPTISPCHGWSDDVHFAETVTTGPKAHAVTFPHWPDATVIVALRDTKSYAAT